MIRVSQAKARLEEQVPELAGRLGSAAQFSALVERNGVPSTTPYAFVLLGGLQGGQASAATGLFIQAIKESLLVVLFVRNASDATGAAAVDELTPLIRKVVEALAGWGPDDCPGVYELVQASIAVERPGLTGFEIQLSLDDQLRIAA